MPIQQSLYVAAGAQQPMEPETPGAAQEDAAISAEPQQRQSTKVPQKKVDLVKVSPYTQACCL